MEPIFGEKLAQLAAATRHVYALLVPLYGADDKARFRDIAALADWAGASVLASFDPFYHAPERRPLQDVVACIRQHVRLDAAGYRLAGNAERHMKPVAEAQRLFADYPQALANIEKLLAACDFSLDELAYQYPEDAFDPVLTPQELLEKLAWDGAHARFPMVCLINSTG